MSKVIIGSARGDERGRASGGKAGDNNKKEVSNQNYYLHSKGWYRLRAYDYQIRQKLADAMQSACDNDNIGYDQNQRLTLYNHIKDKDFNPALATIPCETDCSALVRVCLAYAGIMVGNFTTSNERNVIMATNKFSCARITKESELMRGDILVTVTKGHTVIVTKALNEKPLIPVEDSEYIFYTVQKGDTLSKIVKRYGTTVAAVQKLNPIIKDVNKIGTGWKLRIK